MNLVKVHKDFFEVCKNSGADPNNQLLHNEAGRPCVLLIRLLYRDKYRDFVVPMKSNITPNTDKNAFFPLPPNKRTKNGNFHGIFYIKLFPVHKKYIQRYLTGGDNFLEGVVSIINKPENKSQIIGACQQYLNEYSNGSKNGYTPSVLYH